MVVYLLWWYICYGGMCVMVVYIMMVYILWRYMCYGGICVNHFFFNKITTHLIIGCVYTSYIKMTHNT